MKPLAPLDVKLFAYWVILNAFLSSADFFQNQLFQKILSGIPLECKQLSKQFGFRHFVGPDLGPNYLQRSSADDTSRERVKTQQAHNRKTTLLIQRCCLLGRISLYMYYASLLIKQQVSNSLRVNSPSHLLQQFRKINVKSNSCTLTLCMLGMNSACSVSTVLLFFFKIIFFKKKSFGNTNSFDPI